MSLIEVVLRYAAAGMRIFPVNARGAPLTQHGFKDASTDPEVIRAWRTSGHTAISAGPCRWTWLSSIST